MDVDTLKKDVDFLAGSTSATYAATDKIRNMNVAYNDVARLIWESADGWQYDDSNNTTLPIAKSSLVHNQQDYSLPTSAQRIQRVQVQDIDGNWTKLQQKDIHDMILATEEEQKTPGLPIYYDIMGRSILLYPIPVSSAVTLVSGLQVFVDRDVTQFPVTASSTQPGFATSFHRILSLAAAIDFLEDDSKRQFLAQQKARLEQGLVRFYSKRNVERKNAIQPNGKKRWRQYT